LRKLEKKTDGYRIGKGGAGGVLEKKDKKVYFIITSLEHSHHNFINTLTIQHVSCTKYVMWDEGSEARRDYFWKITGEPRVGN
jgi:hypothetical protein